MVYPPMDTPRSILTFPSTPNRLVDNVVTDAVMKMAELVKGIDYKGKGKMTGKEADDDDDGPFPKKALEWRENGQSRLEWDKRAKYVSILIRNAFLP